jgi:thiamine-phosphate pyrophosphorylase
MRGLYAIVDVATLTARGLDPVTFADAVLSVGPAALQLRAKDIPPRETLALLRALVAPCRRAGVALVANDRPDLALLAGCALVHVGQTDMPIDRVRRLVPGMNVGVSTHSLAQLAAALDARPAYVAFGPVFETRTKANPDPVVGVELLREAYARASAARVPLVAIGGITAESARGLVGSTDAVAVVAELVPPAPVGDERPRPNAELMADVARRAGAIQELFVPRPFHARTPA